MKRKWKEAYNREKSTNKQTNEIIKQTVESIKIHSIQSLSRIQFIKKV